MSLQLFWAVLALVCGSVLTFRNNANKLFSLVVLLAAALQVAASWHVLAIYSSLVSVSLILWGVIAAGGGILFVREGGKVGSAAAALCALSGAIPLLLKFSILHY